MAAPTLDELLAAPTDDEIEQQLVGYLAANNSPVTDYINGGVEKTLVKMLQAAYSDLVGTLIPKIAAGGFPGLAKDGWLQLLAKQVFNLDWIEATYTSQIAVLTCDANNGPYTINAGDQLAETTEGRRYRNTTGGTLSTSGTLSLTWKSESPNDSTNPLTDFVDGADTMTKLVTPLPGVTINNPARPFSPVTLAGESSGLCTPGGSGTPAQVVGTWQVKIVTGGQVGAATFQYRRNGGAWVSGGTVSGTVDIAGGIVQLAFSNGAVNPSFFAGDVFSFQAPGSPIIAQGRDAETDEELAARCIGRWPDLAEVPLEDKYASWARAASTKVRKVSVRASATYGGRVDIIIAGQASPIGVVSDVQTYIDVRAGITDYPAVAEAEEVDIEMSGSVTVPQGQTAAVQTIADAAWSSYIANLPLGGTVRVAALEKIMMDAGAIDIRGIAITDANEPAPGGDSPDVNRKIGLAQVAHVQSDGLPSAELTWLELAPNT